MNRFWSFPLVLALTGILFLPLCFVESILPLRPLASLWQASHAVDDYLSNLWYLWPHFAVGGLLGGVGAALCSVSTGRRSNNLIPNLFWCLVYALGLIEVNVILLHLCHLFYPSQTFASVLWREDVLTIGWMESLLFNFVAIVWATIRTVATEDVLTPKMLMSKLRRSTQAMT